MECILRSNDLSTDKTTAIRFLVEAALKSVASKKKEKSPTTLNEWVDLLGVEIMSDSETSHLSVISSLMATGVSSEEVYQVYVPAVARRIGEWWVQDKVTFVQVTVGAGRLQALFQNSDQAFSGRWLDRTVPLGQSILVVLPETEDHTLGAFVAADQFRRHGIWVRVAIRLEPEEILKVAEEGRFAMIGFSLATGRSIDSAKYLIKILREGLDHCPPIVIGGRYVSDSATVEAQTGADFAVRSVREAIQKCELATVSEAVPFDSMA